MIQYQLKLKLTKDQEKTLKEYLNNLTGVYNWAIRKIELDAKDKIYHDKYYFHHLLANHSKRMGIPSHTLRAIAERALDAWNRCFKRISKKPKLKGQRNKLTSIPFPDPILAPKNNRISIPYIGKVRYHKQYIPIGKIKCGHIIKKASGWYLCLFIDANAKPIPHISDNEIGIDSGFKSLLTLSDGTKIEHPRELEKSAKRLAQAQRGKKKKLTARIYERTSNQRKDRNHKLSRKLVEQNQLIAFSADSHSGIAKKFGKSVSSSSHYQLRRMLSYKSTTSGRIYLEVSSKNSTKLCSNCKSLTGPTGLANLKVREWECSVCGTYHDRDVNAAINTLIVGLGIHHENSREVMSENTRCLV